MSELTTETVTTAIPEGVVIENISGLVETAKTGGITTVDGLKAILGFVPKPVAPPTYVPLTTEQVKAVLPEKMPMADDHLPRVVELATAHKLTADAVKGLFAYSAANAAKNEQTRQEAITARNAQWKSELEKDPLLTADEGFEKNSLKISTVVKDYGGTPEQDGKNEMQTFLEKTGLGNHPTIVRFLARASKGMIGEGGPANPATAPAAANDAQSRANRMFPSSVKGSS